MNRLADILDNPGQYKALVKDCVAMVEKRLQNTSGLSGRVLRSGLQMAEWAVPDLLRRAVERLLPHFMDALEPMHERSLEANTAFGDYILDHREETVERLLAVTDKRIKSIHNRVLRTAYTRLRKHAYSQVEAALPDLAALLNQHWPATAGGGA